MFTMNAMQSIFCLLLSCLAFVVQGNSGNEISSQSQYQYDATGVLTEEQLSICSWNITLIDLLSIDRPAESQGIYNVRTTYELDTRSYDVEIFEKDCETTPTDLDGNPFNFPLDFNTADETVNGTSLTTELEWTYNQSKIQTSSLWTANKTGGNAEFCVRISNYLESTAWDGDSVASDPWYREINFLEITYKIEIDSLTDFNTTIELTRTTSTDVGNNNGNNIINYEEEIVVFQCDSDFAAIPVVPLVQGDFLQLCVKTRDGSRFGVHSIKELDVSQDNAKLFPYVNGFLDSPLTDTACTASNTTEAICRAKMQLLSAYFDEDVPSDLFANGTVKLDYVGRRLSVDVPMKVESTHEYADEETGSDINVMKYDLADAGRMLPVVDKGAPDVDEVGAFVLVVSLDSVEKESDAPSISVGGLFSAALAAFIGAGIV